MSKVVVYNGGTRFYAGVFTKPTMLVKGKKYELHYAMEDYRNTTYVLKGVKGKFNSCWFDDVDGSTEYPLTFLAVGYKFPVIGESLECFKAKYNSRTGGNPEFLLWTTSEVTGIEELGKNTYYVRTLNSAYIVQVSA